MKQGALRVAGMACMALEGASPGWPDVLRARTERAQARYVSHLSRICSLSDVSG